MDKQINLTKATKEDAEWEKDPLGYFLIEPRPKEDLIYIHYYNNQGEYLQSVCGNTTQEIYYTLLRLNLISNLQHAAYIGAELQKAEYSLKNNTPYVQD